MTQDELKQYRFIVQEIRDLSIDIKAMSIEIDRLRTEAEGNKWPDGQPRSHYATDRTAGIVASLADLYAEQSALIEDLLSLRLELSRCRQKIERWIRRLPSAQRQVIRLHYIYGQSWEEIAVRLGYSIYAIWKFHNIALEKKRTNQNALNP